MIPKVIHFCWFSNDKKPYYIRKCLKTWKKSLKGYKIRLWDANSFDFNSIPFVKDAFEHKKWAFVADYIRLYAIYTEGGIYLDSDVAVFKNFDDYLDNNFFAGSDLRRAGSDFYGIEAAIMGAEAGCPLVKEVMEYYEEKDCFMQPDGKFSCKIIPDVMVPYLEKYGYTPANKTQKLENRITIYSTDHFTNSQSFRPELKDKIVAHHYNTATWIDYDNDRSPVYNFFRNHDLLWVFYPIEKCIHKVKGIFKHK